MKKICCALLIAFPVFLSAQNGFTGSLGCGAGFFSLLPEEGFDHKFRAQPGFLLTGEVGYRFADHHEIFLHTAGYNMKYTAEYAWIAIQPNDPVIPMRTVHHHRMLELGIGYTYNHPLNDRIGICITTSADWGTAGRVKEETTFGDGQSRTTDYFQGKQIFSGRLGIGLQSTFTPHLGLRFLPEVKYIPFRLDYFGSESAFAFCCSLYLTFR